MKHLWTAVLWTINVVLYLTIVGIAVGPQLDLPVRIAAIAAAVVYTLGVAVLWGKLDLALQVELSAAALAAVLAFSGWRLGTLAAPNGASLLGLSGDAVGAALLLATLVALIVFVLFAPRVPIVARAVIALAIVYPCVPLGVALSHGNGLSQALATNAPLPRDPGWIRGAFVAAMVVLPIAAVATLIAAIVLVVRKRFHGSSRALAAALVLALTAQMSGLEAANAGLPDVLAVHGTSAPAGAVVAAAGAAGAAGAAAVFGGSTATAAAIASAPATTAATSPPSGATPLATASSDAAPVGGGLGAAFGSIAAETTEDLSNSKDHPRQRIGAFLRKLRNAEKDIPHEDYDPAVLALKLPNDPNAIFAFVRDSIALDDYTGAMRGAKGTLMSRAGNDDDKALLLAELFKDRSIPYRFATSTLSSDDASALVAAAATAPAPAPDDLPDTLYADLGVTKDQVAKERTRRQAVDDAYVGNGIAYAKQRANDLLGAIGNASAPADDAEDLAFKTGAAHTFVQAQIAGNWTDFDPSLGRLTVGNHLGGGTVQTAPALASGALRTVRLRLIATYSGSDQTQIDKTIDSGGVSGTPISIGAAPDVGKLEDVATATAFQTFSSIGSDIVKGPKFALQDAQHHPLTSARLQIDVAGGGAPARTYTRVLWYTGSPTDAALALSRSYEMLIVPGAVGGSFDASMTLATVAAMQPLMIYAALPPSERTLPTEADLQPAYPIELLHFLERDDVLTNGLASSGSSPVRFVYDRPDIVMLTNGFTRVGSAVRATAAVDIVENGRRAVSSDAAAARLANVERGVLETSIEQQVLAYLNKTGTGTPQAFSTAKTSNVATAVVSSSGSFPSGVPVRSQAPLRETLAHGQVALALASSVTLSGDTHYAWWAIDPKTGDTVGRMDDGAGDELVEESALLFYLKRVGMAFTILGCIIAGPSCAEDAEIGIITGGMAGSNNAAGVINEIIGIFKNGYEGTGGDYWGPNGAQPPHGNSYSGGGDPAGPGPPADGDWPQI